MNHVKSRSLLLACCLLLAAAPAGLLAAQRSGAPAGPTRNTYGERAPASPSETDAYEMTRSFSGKIAEIKPEEFTITVEDSKGQVYQFILGGKIKFKADKKTELAEKKDLSLNDFQAGQPVKITYWPSTRKVIEIRLRAEDKT
jgi:hypothetical protein